MAIRFACQHCDKPLKVLDEKIGKKIVCNGCGQISKVPETDAITMEHMGVRRRASTDEPGQTYEELISSYGNSDYGSTSQKINAKESLKLLLRPVLIVVVIVAVLVGAYLLGSAMMQ